MAPDRPSFPSLYNPGVELNSARHGQFRPDGLYLQHTRDIYVFTLYWSFILYTSLFLIAGTVASLFLALEPLRWSRTRTTALTHARSKTFVVSQRRFIAYAVVVFLAYAVMGAFLAFLGSTVIAFLIAGVYAAGGFQVSTWVPFVWALLQSLVALTSMCSLIIEII